MPLLRLQRKFSSAVRDRVSSNRRLASANQPQILLSVQSRRQLPASAPFLKNIRLRLFPCHQRSSLGLEFEDTSPLQAKLLPQFLGYCELTIFSQDHIHGPKIRFHSPESRTAPR